MPTVNIDVEIEVYCATCGEGLCGKTTVSKTRGRQQDNFQVEACSKCMSNAYDEGYEKARAEFDKK